ncbi:MAG: SusD/RagB family nutrient-binding outer membrane lipoprotein, partial [Bacteroidales bacterium]|nr:SusD/RagB family nutrient-binding outer membrane lipoprotein [Candidatus Cacconaster merdequi]
NGFYYHTIKELNTIIAMNEDPEQNQLPNVAAFCTSNANQIAAAKTLRAYYMMSISDILGAVPYTEAWKGDEDVWQPKYDSQEDIYKMMDAELCEAYNLFDEKAPLNSTYEILYKGDIAKWKKFNATLRMMMAIKMAEVDPANGKARFAKAFADGGMTDVKDSFCYTMDTKQGADYSLYHQGTYYNTPVLRWGPNAVIVEMLKEYNDPRMFEYFTLDGYVGKVEGDPKDVKSYKGVYYGLESNAAVDEAKKGACSIADKYMIQESTYGVITTARCLLVEAEAAKLGWISASAEDLYYKGIKASFDFEGAEGYDEYIASDKVKFNGTLEQIVTQRYLAGFMTDGIEAWSDWRRYNIPTLPIMEGQAIEGITVYPYRMEYYNDDYNYNGEQVKKAVDTYLGGKDSRWSRVWWDVKDNI